MEEPGSFDHVIGRLHDGDPDAAAEVFRRFGARLRGLVWGRLEGRLRAKVDPDDVLQSAFRTFFEHERNGEFHFDDWNDLWALLVRITLRKCARRRTAFHRECRDANREIAEDARDRAGGLLDDLAAREPTPDEAAALGDLLEFLMRGLDETQRQILALRLQGYEEAEIGREVGRSSRTVRRVLTQVRHALERMDREEGDV